MKKLTCYTNENGRRYIDHSWKIDKSKDAQVLTVPFFESTKEMAAFIESGELNGDTYAIVWGGAHKSLTIAMQAKIRNAAKGGKISEADRVRIHNVIFQDNPETTKLALESENPGLVISNAVLTVFNDASITPVDAVKIAIESL